MLEGIKIIDFSLYVPGPYATQRLVELGAEVIRVESPGGDPIRFPPEKDSGDRYMFRSVNRGKKSIVLDLKEESGRNTIQKLISQADVILESFRPGVADRLGIGYEQAKRIKPDIVYCSLSGYGQDGVMHQYGSHDINYLSLSGVLSQMKDDQGNPVPPGIPFADMIGGITASEAIAAALFQRERTGKGAYLDIPLLDAVTSIMATHVLVHSADGGINGYTKISRYTISYAIYKTKDDRFVSLAAAEPKFWKNFCEAVNKEKWIAAHKTAPREDNPVFREITDLFRSRTFEEWAEFSHKVDCCMTPVLEVGELYRHPYHRERKLIQEKWGLMHTHSAIYSGDTWLERSTHPPRLNEHSKEMVGEL